MRRRSPPAHDGASIELDDSSSSRSQSYGGTPSIGGVLAVLYLVACFYLSMEWVFFATKASFMDSFSRIGRLTSLLLPPAGLTLAAAPFVMLLAWFDDRVSWLQSRIMVPSFFLASSVFLLVDNFSYTVLHFGVVTSRGIIRFAYLLLFLLLLLRAFHWSRSAALRWDGLRRRHPIRLMPWVLAAISVIAAGVQLGTTDFALATPDLESIGGEPRRPNIILLSTDGVEARLMSVYGYPLPTTPFLARFARRALVFENAFANSGKTTGSLSAMLSGSLPSVQHVGFPPHIFPKAHAVRHLPALLNALGYEGYQRSVRYYADAGDLNMISSFNVANGRRLWAPTPGTPLGLLAYFLTEETQFSTRMFNRLAERLLHIFAIRPIINHYLLVKEGAGLGRETDAQSVEDALAFIRSRDGPYFMQIHLMGTHCCSYQGARPWFEVGELPDHPGSRSRQQVAYLNSIRDADQHMQSFLERLEAEGGLENTIVIISSDHSQSWDSIDRVPLMVRFPEEMPRGRVERNVALNQVPATILEYLGIARPAWMIGGSLLSERRANPPFEEALTSGGVPPILSLARFEYSSFAFGDGRLSRIDHPGPPLYGVREVGLVIGPNWNKLDLRSGKMTSGLVRQHSRSEEPPRAPSHSEVRRYIVRHLEASGFTLPPSFGHTTPAGASGFAESQD